MASLIFLTGVCVWQFIGFGEFTRSLPMAIDPTKLTGGRVSDWDDQKAQNTLMELKKPAPWVRDDQVGHQVFIARQMKYNPETKKAEWVDLKNETVDGIPFWWLDKYGLPKAEGVGKADPDGDGFTNYQEYYWFAVRTEGKKEIDPMSKESHPDWATKLQGKQYIKENFKILFKEYNENAGKVTFQINREDKSGRSRTEFLALGEKSTGADGVYVLEKFEKKKEKRMNASTGVEEMIDTSVLIVRRDDGLEIPLTIGSIQEASIISAIIEFPFANGKDERLYTVKKDEIITLKEKKYKVIDIRPSKVTLESEDVPNQEFEVIITEN